MEDLEKENFLFYMMLYLMTLPTKLLKKKTNPFKLALKFTDASTVLHLKPLTNPEIGYLHCPLLCKTISATFLLLTTSSLVIPDFLAAKCQIFGSNLENQVILGRMLLEAGADVNSRTRNEYTPLFIACHSHHICNADFIRLLLDYSADPNARTSDGQTPLMASIPFALPASTLLLTYKYKGDMEIDVNAKKDGKTVHGILQKYMEGFSGVTLDTAADRAKLDYVLTQMQELAQLLASKGAV